MDISPGLLSVECAPDSALVSEGIDYMLSMAAPDQQLLSASSSRSRSAVSTSTATALRPVKSTLRTPASSTAIFMIYFICAGQEERGTFETALGQTIIDMRIAAHNGIEVQTAKGKKTVVVDW